MEEDSLHGPGDGADHGDDDDDSMRISAVAIRRDRQLSFVGVVSLSRSDEVESWSSLSAEQSSAVLRRCRQPEPK